MSFWSFGAIFVDFSEARDLFVNIFQISDLTEKFAKQDRGLILEKQRGFFAKWRGNFGRDLFFNG
jgi:hypothetical protein